MNEWWARRLLRHVARGEARRRRRRDNDETTRQQFSAVVHPPQSFAHDFHSFLLISVDSRNYIRFFRLYPLMLTFQTLSCIHYDSLWRYTSIGIKASFKYMRYAPCRIVVMVLEGIRWKFYWTSNKILLNFYRTSTEALLKFHWSCIQIL